MLYQVVLCTEAISEMYVTQIPLIRKHCEPTIHLQSDIKIIQYIYIYILSICSSEVCSDAGASDRLGSACELECPWGSATGWLGRADRGILR